MKTIAIIPARAGSKRLPGKNVKLLDGIPLIKYSILFAKRNMDILDEIIVTTDDIEVKEIALSEKVTVIDRPDILSGDDVPTVSAMRHVLWNLEMQIGNVILLQPTNPLRPEDLLVNAWEKYNKGKYDSLMTVSRDDKKLGKIIENVFHPFNYNIGQRSQDLEPLYFENGLLYISKANLIQKNILIGDNNFPYQINHPYARVDIDTIEDFEYAEFLLKRKK